MRVERDANEKPESLAQGAEWGGDPGPHPWRLSAGGRAKSNREQQGKLIQ